MSNLPEKTSKDIVYTPFGDNKEIKLNVAIVKRMLTEPTRNGHVATDEDCMKFMMLCRSRELNPFEGDAFLLGYDTKNGPKFSLVTAHQAFLKRAQLSEEFDGMESGVIVRGRRHQEIEERDGDFYMEDEEELLGGWARVHLKTRKIPVYRKLQLSKYRKQFGVWQENPAMMIVKCAEADALRSAFPNKLSSLYLREELYGNREAPSKPQVEAKQDDKTIDVSFLNSEPGEVTVEAEPEPAPTPEPEPAPVEQQDPVVVIATKCKVAGVRSSDLLAYLGEAAAGAKSITALAKKDLNTVQQTANDIEAIIEQIKQNETR